MLAHKRHALALAAETGVFQGQQGRDGVAVVDLRGIHIRRLQPGHLESAARRRADRCVQHVVGIGRRLEGQVLTETCNECRAFACPSSHFLGRDDHGRTACHRHDDFQYMQRVGDLTAGQYLLDGQRLAIEHGLRVGQCIGALVHGNLGHGHRVIAVLRSIALGNHGVAGVLPHVPVRQILARPHRCHPCRQHAQYRLAQAQFDCRRRTPDHPHGGTAAEIDHFGKVEFQAQVFGGHGRHEH
ncbi:hypothetical protein D3C85_1253800 [compost metagenome]